VPLKENLQYLRRCTVAYLTKEEPIEDVGETDMDVNTTDFDGENMKHSADEEKLASLNGFHVSETVYDSTLGESLLTDTDNNHGNIRETNNIDNTGRSSTQKSERGKKLNLQIKIVLKRSI
jgi:hypothetical protein